MSQGDENTEKEHEPTQKKLDDARSKGEVPKSNDLITAASYGGLLLSMVALGPQTVESIGATLAGLLAKSDQFADLLFQSRGTPLASAVVSALGLPLLGWFGLPALAVILTVVAQRAFVFAPSKLQPKLNRLSIIQNAKNKFGISGLFEFFKSFLKLTIYSLILGIYLYAEMPNILTSAQLAPTQALTRMGWMMVEFLSIVLVVAAVIGVVDLIFQHQEHTRKNRMSRKELMDETKQNEGDPHLKQHRRQKAYDIATNKMLTEVPEADVIIVNPTHYAVALKWSRAAGSAPVCVAKGVDEIATRIREIAAESAVPIHRDPPTARALFASVELGQEILPEHYEPVAAAIRFAEAMRAKAKEGAH